MKSCLEATDPHVIRKLGGTHDPAKIFRAVSRCRGAIHLTGPTGFGRLSRWTIAGCNPIAKLVWREGVIETTNLDLPPKARRNPFAALRAALEAHQLKRVEMPLPLSAGFIGYMSYDLKNYVEKLPPTAKRDCALPDMYFGLYDALVIHDNITGETSLIGAPIRSAESMLANLDFLENLIKDENPEPLGKDVEATAPLRSNFTREQYIEALRATCKYIYDGDIFQANISQRFETLVDCDSASLFARLCEVNPAPFAAYIAMDGNLAVLSSSPERFLKVDGQSIETRPIKGTRRRTGDPDRDRKAKEDLLSSAKDNAELAMIVDLERNDFGRVAEYGTVCVDEARVLETYPTVYHLVSTVTGRLRRGRDIVDLLKASFPGGSITGAPKIRAMEIINELEPTPRSVYTGSIGYISCDGRADLNIAIRTILYEAGRVTFQVGGGIVADSDPDAEYQETLDKGRALAQSLGFEI